MTAYPPYGSAPQYAPRPPKPPLTSAAKGKAATAGIVSFLLVSLGWFLILTPIVLGFIGGIFVFIAEIIQRAPGADPEDEEFVRFLDDIDLAAWWPLLLVLALVGVGVWVLGLFTSVWILRSSELREQAWGITWAGLGVAVLASTFVGGLLSGLLQLVASIGSFGDPLTSGLVWGIVGTLGSVVVTGAIGWLSWWWMAHLLRPAERGADLTSR